MHYYVAGVNGSGKSTLLRAIADQTNYRIIPASSQLIKFLGLETYEQLRAMPQDQVLAQYSEMTVELLKQNTDEDMLFDTHLLNLTKGQIIDRSGPWIANFDALVLIDAPTNQILGRIESDSERDRALFPGALDHNIKLQMLDNYIDKTKTVFKQLANEYKLPRKVILNNQGALQAAVDEFVRFDNWLREGQ